MSIEMLGYVAGAINLGSSGPQIAKSLWDGTSAGHQSLLRNLMIAASNALWCAYGIVDAAMPIAVMCGLGCALNAVICVQIIRARRPPASRAAV